MSATKTWHSAHLLKLAFRCMRSAEPIRWRQAVEKCRTSRRERRLIIRDLRAHFYFPILCVMDGVGP